MEQSVTKAELRDQMRAARREHVNAQPDVVRALLFNHPPRPILESIPSDAVIGLYHATSSEAPTAAYAQFFQEKGHTLALPRFASPEAPMGFAVHTDAFVESDLESGPFG
ncbi:MAG: 5-formyltetrahydrofolate cyclo-ligase, partial [Pseudomonadota bacterium]